MPRMAILFALFCFSSCLQSQKKGELIFLETPRESLKPTINKRNFKGSVDYNEDILLINNDYPIEIRLYQNKKFYFNLPNLGEGEGAWEYDGGKIKLMAEYHVEAIDFTIDMNYFIGLIDKKGSLAINFTDRFGPKILKLDKVNQHLSSLISIIKWHNKVGDN